MRRLVEWALVDLEDAVAGLKKALAKEDFAAAKHCAAQARDFADALERWSTLIPSDAVHAAGSTDRYTHRSHALVDEVPMDAAEVDEILADAGIDSAAALTELVGLMVDGFAVAEWTPSLDGTGTPEAVALIFNLRSHGDVVLRLRSRRAVQETIDALRLHMDAVFPERCSDPEVDLKDLEAVVAHLKEALAMDGFEDGTYTLEIESTEALAISTWEKFQNNKGCEKYLSNLAECIADAARQRQHMERRG